MTEDVRYNQYRNDCLNATKLVIKKTISTNKLKHIEYVTVLTNMYNIYTIYAKQIYANKSAETKQKILQHLGHAYDRINRGFEKINIRINLEKRLGVTINEREVLGTFSEEELRAYREKQEDISRGLEGTATNSESSNESNAESNSDTDIVDRVDKQNTMAMTNVEFLAIAARTINRNYDGDPLALKAFTNSIRLLNDICTPALTAFYIRFIKSKLEGKALESIPENVATVEEIINALENKIKPDNSKVIAGRMLALRPDNNKLSEFSHQAEQLAEALQRSLIIEGIPQNKACEMAIDKTTELCRGVARSDLVKSVLASAKFDSPKEVVAKYLTENATEKTEKQILAYKKYGGNEKYADKRNRGGYRGNYRGYNRGRYRGNYRYNNNNGQGNRRYGSDNRYNSNRGASYRNSSYRGNGRGGYERNVRYAENGEAPQVNLGDAQNN